MRTRFIQQPRRSALTLIELMIVMGLLIILASISLGALKTLLRGQKVNQAAITVRQYLQNAQMRAVASGRPVAVFLDRLNMVGSASDPVPANYSVTRLQVGEVFPPYTGDVENVIGILGELDYSTLTDGNGNIATSRGPNDGHADQIIFSLVDVVSAFGNGNSADPLNNGFIKPGDLIEFEGFEGRYSIERYQLNSNGTLSVHFFNPPVGYTNLRNLKTAASRHAIYEKASYAPVGPQMRVPAPGMSVRFRAYRQPTRSLVGSIVLPRGTCIDLSVSGIGLNDSALEPSGSFHLSGPPAGSSTPNPGDFSRIALVFNSDGRLGYLIDENTLRDPKKVFGSGSSMIYLMIGRIEQVLPGFPVNSLKLSSIQHPDYGAGELPPSNLANPESVWVTCNPFTGEVKTSPVADTSEAIPQRMTDLQGDPNYPMVDMIRASRALAAAGMTN
jgi:type II secretory pathway pseudopilin PulG